MKLTTEAVETRKKKPLKKRGGGKPDVKIPKQGFCKRGGDKRIQGRGPDDAQKPGQGKKAGTHVWQKPYGRGKDQKYGQNKPDKKTSNKGGSLKRTLAPKKPGTAPQGGLG